MSKRSRKGRLLAGASLVTAASAALAGTAAAAPPLGPDEVAPGGEGPVWVKVLNIPSVVEGNAGQKLLSFPVTLSKPSGNPVVVTMKTYKPAAPAEPFKDYVPKVQDLKFQPGQTKRFFQVVMNADTVDEPVEYVGAMATGADKATVLDKTGWAKIADDDDPPKLSISDVEQAEGTGGPTGFQFAVTLSAKSEKKVTVQVSPSAGSAVTPADWQAAPANLTFEPGQIEKGYAVSVVGDDDPESDETFTAKLSDAVNAELGNASGAGKILDDDTDGGGGGNGGNGGGTGESGGGTGEGGGGTEQALGSEEELVLDQAEERDNGVMPWVLVVAGLTGIGLLVLLAMRRRRRRQKA